MAKMAAAREIRVARRDGHVFRCRSRWTVDEAKAKIRMAYGLEFGGIHDQVGAFGETDVIGDAVGDLTFVGGRDLPPPQPAIATAITQPAGMFQTLMR
jgi:hypothetical protein